MGDLAGIHHVTAIAGDPQRNVDFYTGFLGLRLVKVTVNFDAPDTYHLYYGDGMGRPGTLLTFFPWPGARRGRKGAGQASVVAFAIPEAALRFWGNRLHNGGIPYEGPINRWGHNVLTFFDPDDLQIELVACPEADTREPWAGGPVPAEFGLRGLYGVTLIEDTLKPLEELLAHLPGFRWVGAGANNRYRYAVGVGSTLAYVDLLVLPGMGHGQMGTGAIHHVAWRTPASAEQIAWRTNLLELRLPVTPVLDRKYFQSIYFREPGGVLFEMATDGPGFTVDEPETSLGSTLQLPANLEGQRAEIEDRLPPLVRLPTNQEWLQHILGPIRQAEKHPGDQSHY